MPAGQSKYSIRVWRAFRRWIGNVVAQFRASALIFRPGRSCFFLLIPLQDTHPGSAQAEYDHAVEIFQRGDLARSQQEAERGFEQFQVSDPEWAVEVSLA